MYIEDLLFRIYIFFNYNRNPKFENNHKLEILINIIKEQTENKEYKDIFSNSFINDRLNQI